ncbi:nicotinate-nucleotide--dimethylbenzimidazole phosphoribosyltransferase [Streptomyces sp. NPDC046909]|uniref:nicotinate-nucleotide--dimethylbenzimidazole phosphoribosyltransferase n=1 Tax=Streptomyces sp. NPDC046909 TaxID=3155617 RepID=UPI0033FE8B79
MPDAGGVPGTEGAVDAGPLPGAVAGPVAAQVPDAGVVPGPEGVVGVAQMSDAVAVPGDASVPGSGALPEAVDASVPEGDGGQVAAHTPYVDVAQAGDGSAAAAAVVVPGPEEGAVPSAGPVGVPVGAEQTAGLVPGGEESAVGVAPADGTDHAVGLIPGAVDVTGADQVPGAVDVADGAQAPEAVTPFDAEQIPGAVPVPAPEADQTAEAPELQPVPVSDAPSAEADQVVEPAAIAAAVAEPEPVPAPVSPDPEPAQIADPGMAVAEAAVPLPAQPDETVVPEALPATEATTPTPAPEIPEAVPFPESADAEQPPHLTDTEAAAQPEIAPADLPLAAAPQEQPTEQPPLVDAAQLPVAPDAPHPAPVPLTAPATAPGEHLHATPAAAPAPATAQAGQVDQADQVDQAAPAPTPSLISEPAGPQVLFVDHAPPAAEPPVGQFVPVEGSVPTTPHLAPTPPQPLVLPPEEHPAVPAPRDGDPELVQHADDLDTRGADQEESTAPVEEVRQSTGPAAPAYDDAEREAVLKVMRERRDIRNGFRSDPIPHEVLLRVLEAAHTAPSVGHSQPWDFVVIRSAETRRTMHELAMRQRDAYAKSLPKGRAKQFKELKIEAILDTPVNIVVTADPTRGGRHTLGRHTQPQMAPYSSALAVENLWLAARAEGLGVGWVSFFDEREMVRSLGLPEHLEVVAYLCVGYVDEFPDEPELMQAGWSKRRPLSWVVHEETYGRRALPGEEPHDLLAETVAQIRPLDAKALGEAWERQKRMTKPAGALGMLEIISAQLSGLSRQCPPPIPEPAAVAIFAGDHGVHAQGVTPWPQEVTAQMVANFLGGGAVCNAFAGQVGAEVCVVDVGVAADLPATPGLLPRKIRAGTSDMTTGPAMTREEAKQAIEVGIETARDLVAAGNKALLTGEMGIANTTASAALISVFTDTDPAEVTGRGTGINDETLARKTEVVRRAIEVHQPDPADPIGVLAAIGGFEHAAMVGLLLGGASLRTPVILDGVSAGAAALVARAIAPEVLAACIAGHRSAEPGHVAALNKLGLRPLVDLDLRLGEGTGALLALPLVQSTARAMHEVATFDSAGVTEK